jgi:Zn-dependent M28 family amino/carboxypeptidase
MTGKIDGAGLYQVMADLVGLGHRVSGTATERAAADYIANAFREAGLTDVAYESFNIRRYEISKLSLTLFSGGTGYPLPAHPFWYATGGRVRGEAVSVGLGTPMDFSRIDVRGKIAVVESRILLNYMPTHFLFQTYQQAVANGATGYVVWVNAPFDLAPRYNHLKEDEPAGPIPAALLTFADGMFLSDALQNDSEVEVELELEAEEHLSETGDVVGYLPGGDDVVIVGSHYDSVYDGAVDNAAANAGLIGLARAVAAWPEPRPTFVFAAHPGHEVNVGAREFVLRHKDLVERAALYLSLDGFASSGFSWTPLGAIATGTDEKRGITVSDNPLLLSTAVKAVRDHDLMPAVFVPASEIVFNQDLEGRFHALGTPILMIIGKPIWYHTLVDTLDKVTPDQLERSYQAHLQILEDLLTAGFENIRASDRLPLDDVLNAVLPEERFDVGHEGGLGLAFGILPDPIVSGQPSLLYINDFSNPRDVALDMEWSFGDGHHGRGPFKVHVYEKPGRYQVSINVTDAGGAVSTYQRSVWVK